MVYKIDPTLGEEDIEEVKKGVRLQIEMNNTKGFPIARYDAEARKPYLEYPDGRKVYKND